MRVLFVNQYFEPDVAASGLLAADICESLAAQEGWEIHVVCGQPSYTENAERALALERRGALTIHRIDMARARGKASMRTRVLGYIKFLRAAKRKCDEIARTLEFDAVVTMTNPPFVGGIGARLRRKGMRFIYVVHDIHPDVLVATGWGGLPRIAIRWWQQWSRKTLAQADRVIVLGESMKSTLVSKKGVDATKIDVIPLWGRPEIEPGRPAGSVREALGIGDGKTLILCAGNLGIMHPLDPIIDAAKSLPSLHVLFIGEGDKKQALMSRVEDEMIANVSFLTYQPAEKFADIVRAADLCAVTLEPGLEGLAVPSRSFTFLSAGKPLITIMSPSADVARICELEECGWNVTDAPGLMRRLESLSKEDMQAAGARAADAYNRRFRKDAIVSAYADAITRRDP
jgi:glycosyltransferase involved in cell wall biosynthesis